MLVSICRFNEVVTRGCDFKGKLEQTGNAQLPPPKLQRCAYEEGLLRAGLVACASAIVPMLVLE